MMPDPGSQKPPPVISEIVQQEFCCGCGVCAAVCPTQCLQMDWNEYGMRVPRENTADCSHCNLCLNVCPFGDHGVTEDDLAQQRFGGVSDISRADALGYCLGAYVGHVTSAACRADGSSGGVARWFLASLLKEGRVERVLGVIAGTDSANLFRFAEMTSPQEVLTAAKSAYYPTDIAEVLRSASEAEGRCAIIGLPCVAKAVRLAARRTPGLADRIGMVAGLVCGHLPGRGFVEYLARHLGVAPQQLQRVSFREKAPDQPAYDFHFRAVGEDDSGSVGFTSPAFGGTFMRGEFKLRACDLCDDIFAETADVAFMDAWLPAYRHDPKGTSIVVTRSTAADDVIRQGIEHGELELQPIDLEDVLRSQTGRIENKRRTLAHRLWMMEAADENPPSRRVRPTRPEWHERLVLAAYEQVRKTSHEAMRRQHEAAPTGLQVYHRGMRWPIVWLAFVENAFSLDGIRRLFSKVLRHAKRVLKVPGRTDDTNEETASGKE